MSNNDPHERHQEATAFPVNPIQGRGYNSGHNNGPQAPIRVHLEQRQQDKNPSVFTTSSFLNPRLYGTVPREITSVLSWRPWQLSPQLIPVNAPNIRVKLLPGHPASRNGDHRARNEDGPLVTHSSYSPRTRPGPPFACHPCQQDRISPSIRCPSNRIP